MSKYIYIFVFLALFNVHALDNFSQNTLSNAKNKYGTKVLKRINAWDKVIHKSKKVSSLKKLKYINSFFNKIRYKTDIKHWRKNDYWATPMEFVGTLRGDCEDYAIAKYFALQKAGVSTKKLRIAYVKYRRNRRSGYDENHMVLLYVDRPNAVPIVLDNINKKLQLATKRYDLKLVYSFNALGLWKSKNRGRQIRVGSNKLHKWKKLINKI